MGLQISVTVFDIWKQEAPLPVDIKKHSIYHDYDVLEEIGIGAFGVVHRCVEKQTGRTFAAKFVSTNNEKEKSTVRKEINVMSELRHPMLINLHDAYEDEHDMVMIYEFLSGGELFEKVSDEKNRMTETEAVRYIRQVCEALKHMHEKSYVHLDLKPENIMFTTRQSEQLKLIDFGLAAKLDPDNPVKVTTGTAEFASPELVRGDPVSFATDMWSVGVLTYILLSGLSPFCGENDDETLKHVRLCDWNMDDPQFDSISDSAKDFIRKLLVANTNGRLSVHEALEHQWLRGHQGRNEQIPSSRYHQVRDSVRGRYDSWPDPNPPMGRVANFSSLRTQRPSEYSIFETLFERSCAAPRFVLKPYNTSCNAGDTITFYARVVSDTLVTVTWYRRGEELQQGVKFMKRSNGNEYALTITRTKPEDQADYQIRAKNQYGSVEASAYLTVQKSLDFKPQTLEILPPQRPVVKLPEVHEFQEKRSAPHFSFPLRPRLIQKNHGCKLICTVVANPQPQVEWLKDGVTIDGERCQILYKSGVCTLELFNARLEDAGDYVCKAKNSLGESQSVCRLTVQKRGPLPMLENPLAHSPSMTRIRPSPSRTAVSNGFDLLRSSTAVDLRQFHSSTSSSSSKWKISTQLAQSPSTTSVRSSRH
ncbi:Immunoglobulin I-set domain protein [Aphelenchoides besseyi]|nr:Immunoglobulin I-set domain protein [Aphelenchoides besseyi]